jgi:hypothetical protein
LLPVDEFAAAHELDLRRGRVMTTTEQEVDFAAIRVGDKVKLRYHGLESTDWHEVIHR